MEVIEVHAGPDDLNKLVERVAPFLQSCFIRRQIAGDDVRQTRDQREMLPASQVVLGIDLGRSLPEVRDSAGDPFEPRHTRRSARVATIAVGLGIHDIAPQSH